MEVAGSKVAKGEAGDCELSQGDSVTLIRGYNTKILNKTEGYLKVCWQALHVKSISDAAVVAGP